MSATYDNWERVVGATLRREQFRELERASSIETGSSSTCSSFNLKSARHGDFGQQISAWNRLTDQVIKGVDAVTSFKLECLDLKSKTQQLKLLLHHAIPVSDTRANHRIMDDMKMALHLAASLIRRCSGMRCIFTNISSATFDKVSTQMEHCIWNLSGIIRDEQPRVSCYICTLTAILIGGSPDDQVQAAIWLATLAHDGLYSDSINKKCGVQALFTLLERVKMERQDYANIPIRNPEISLSNCLCWTDTQHSELLVPCIKTVGNLHGVSCEADTWMIKSLWTLLADINQGTEVHEEACIALSKFARYENFPPAVCSHVISTLRNAEKTAYVHVCWSAFLYCCTYKCSSSCDDQTTI